MSEKGLYLLPYSIALTNSLAFTANNRALKLTI